MSWRSRPPPACSMRWRKRSRTFLRDSPETSTRPIQERIGKAIARLDVIYAEVKRERMTQLANEPDPGPLLRTLLRLRHDLVIVGRAAAVALAQGLAPR